MSKGWIVAVSGALLLAGCEVTVTPGPVPGPGPVAPPGICVQERASAYVGQSASNQVQELARTYANAATVRVLLPGQIVTQEYSQTRLTLEVNNAYIIVSGRCG